MSDCSPYHELLPEWLPDKAVADELFAVAYESCTNAQRGWLKKTISLHFALSGESPASRSVQMDFPRLGVRTACRNHPADWCVLLLPHDVVSPVRVLAAAVPAMLSGVGELIVIRQTENESGHCSEWPAGVLVGLELAGVRKIFDLTRRDTEKLLGILLGGKHSGRLLMLDSCDCLSEAVLKQIHEERRVRSWIGKRPHIGVCRQPSESVAVQGGTLAEVLDWAHPDATLEYCQKDLSEACAASYDALLTAAYDQEKTRKDSGMVLGPGMEGCWIWPDLDRDFFLCRTVCCTSVVLPESE